MAPPRVLSPRPWLWFGVWALVGAMYVVAFVGITSIGLFVFPVAVAATVLLGRWRYPVPGIFGLVSGLGLPFLFIAYLNRRGPVSCNSPANVGHDCDQLWSPWPWVGVGLAVVLIGVGLFIWQSRSGHVVPVDGRESRGSAPRVEGRDWWGPPPIN
jgi:hypothetical protein